MAGRDARAPGIASAAGTLARGEGACRLDEADELGAVAAQVCARRGARQLRRAVERRLTLVARVAQEQAELRDRRRELEVLRGVAEARLAVEDADVQRLARVAVRLLVAELHRQKLVRARALRRPGRAAVLQLVHARVLDLLPGGHDLVERRDRVAGAYLARVLPVVVEVAVGEQTVLVADEAVARDEARVELDLYLHVLGDGRQS